MRRIIALLALTLAAASCTPEDIQAVQSYHAEQAAGFTCPGSEWGDEIATSFNMAQWDTACRVMLCESHGHGQDPVTIKNMQGSSASGLFQFLRSTWQSARRLVPGAEQYAEARHAPGDVQVEVAARWRRETSWSQWECY